jgi:hypothetical protein
MRCANPACGAETLYLRSGGLFEVDYLGESGPAGKCQKGRRRVIWLCDACAGTLAVETWRPPGEQVRPSGSSSAAACGSRYMSAAERWD